MNRFVQPITSLDWAFGTEEKTGRRFLMASGEPVTPWYVVVEGEKDGQPGWFAYTLDGNFAATSDPDANHYVSEHAAAAACQKHKITRRWLT